MWQGHAAGPRRGWPPGGGLRHDGAWRGRGQPGQVRLRKLGKRKQWIVTAQVLLGAILVSMSLLDPKSSLGWFSLLAGIGGVTINVLLTKMLVDWFVGREISTAMALYINSFPVGIALALLVLPHAATGGLAAAWAATLLVIATGLVLFILGHRAPGNGPGVAPALETGRLPLAPLLSAGWIWAAYNAAIAMVFSFGPVLLMSRGWTLAAATSSVSLCIALIAVSQIKRQVRL